MYILIDAVLRGRAPNSKYESVDVSNMSVPDVFKNYTDGFLILEHTDLISPIYVPIRELKSTPLPYGIFPFGQWLNMVGDYDLPNYTQVPSYRQEQVIFMDGLSTGFEIKRVVPVSLNDSTTLPLSTMTDLLVTLGGVSSRNLNDYLLCTINGILHYSYHNNKGMVVTGAGKTVDQLKNFSFGFLNFEKIGKINPVKINIPMISGDRYAGAVYINTGMDLSNKSVILSLAGVLHVNDKIYDVINPKEGIVQIKVAEMDLLDRIRVLQQVIDVRTPLGLTGTSEDPLALDRAQVYSNEVIEKILLLPQSFLVVVETTHLYGITTEVGQTPLPFLYEYHKEPTLPLRDTYGFLPEYIKGLGLFTIPEEVNWSLAVRHDTWVQDSLDNTTPTIPDEIVGGANQVIQYKPHDCQFFEIGSQKLVLT